MPIDLPNKCSACTAETPRIGMEDLSNYMQLVPGWKAVSYHHIERIFRFDDFKGAMDFANTVAKIAEEEGHHPKMIIEWGKVKVQLWTHKIDGLSENDFVMAKKIG